MAHPQRPIGVVEGINVTPLVDITLVLLVVTFVTAQILETPAVPLDLPSAAQSNDVQVVLSIVLPQNGGVLIDGHPVADAEVRERAKAALARSPALRAVIQADGDVPHRRVVHVMDILRQAGVSHVAFGVEPSKERSVSE